MRSLRPSLPALVLCAAAPAFTGCHSAMVDATLRNSTPTPMRVVELDYPSASFGVQALAPGQTFHYRFKILGDGGLKLSYTTPEGKLIETKGPTLHEGQEGTLTVTVQPTGVDWQSHLHPPA